MAEKHDKADIKADKKIAATAVHKHEKKMHPGKPLTKLRAGGVTSKSMMQMGRNLARVANQKSTGRGG